jgi:hypothetical protein
MEVVHAFPHASHELTRWIRIEAKNKCEFKVLQKNKTHFLGLTRPVLFFFFVILTDFQTINSTYGVSTTVASTYRLYFAVSPCISIHYI